MDLLTFIATIAIVFSAAWYAFENGDKRAGIILIILLIVIVTASIYITPVYPVIP